MADRRDPGALSSSAAPASAASVAEQVPAQRRGEDQTPGDADSWQRVWREREALLRMARRRSACAADAEDAVAEAMVLSHESDDIEYERVGSWLTTVTARLCVNEARERAREPKRVAYQARQGLVVDGPDDAVCDQAEAVWLASHLEQLPPRQRRALELKAEGLDVAALAQAMNVSYKVADGLLQRARAHMRSVLATAAGWLGLVAGSILAWGRRSAPAAATAATVAVSFVVALHHVPVGPGGQQHATPLTAQAPVAGEVAPPAQTPTAPEQDPLEPVRAQQRPPPAERAAAAEPRQPGLVTPTHPLPNREAQTHQIGDIQVNEGGTTDHKPEESFLDSVQTCLQRGPEVSDDFVGCRPD